MKIDINKDFNEAFPHTVWKGLSAKECISALVAFLSAGAVILIVWQLTGLPINVCVYFGFPVMIPIIFLGVYTYQNTGMVQLVQEMMFTWKTRKLKYEAGEIRESDLKTFTLKHKEGKK